MISPAQHTRVAGVSIFIFNSVSSLEAGLWPRRKELAATPVRPSVQYQGANLRLRSRPIPGD